MSKLNSSLKKFGISNLLLCSILTINSHADFSPSFTETFHENLDDKWHWVRERKEGWKLEDGVLKLLCADGTIYKDNTHPIPLLLRPAKLEEGLETRVRVRTDTDVGQTGLMWYYDDNNYVKFVKEKLKRGMTIVYAREIDSATSNSSIDYPDKEVELRLVYKDNIAHAYFRSIGDKKWTESGKFELPSKPEDKQFQVGLFSHSGKKQQVMHSLSNFQKYQPSSTTASLSNEWKPLFDGKSLEGWNEQTKKDSFEVIDGTIVGTNIVGKGTTYLCNEQEFGDFELRFDMKFHHTNINSGVQIRSKQKNGSGAVYGPQVDVGVKGKTTRSGMIFGQSWGGWITPEDVESHDYMKPTEWNSFKVLAVGNKVKTWINDQFVCETIIPDERHKTNSKGFIALQLHNLKKEGPSQVAWKNIRIKEIN